MYPFTISSVIPRPIGFVASLSKEVSPCESSQGRQASPHGSSQAASLPCCLRVVAELSRCIALPLLHRSLTRAPALTSCRAAGRPQPVAILILQCHVSRPAVRLHRRLRDCREAIKDEGHSAEPAGNKVSRRTPPILGNVSPSIASVSND